MLWDPSRVRCEKSTLRHRLLQIPLLGALSPSQRFSLPQEYKAQMPKYADECLDYQDLWNKVIETHKNAENVPRHAESAHDSVIFRQQMELMVHGRCNS